MKSYGGIVLTCGWLAGAGLSTAGGVSAAWACSCIAVNHADMITRADLAIEATAIGERGRNTLRNLFGILRDESAAVTIFRIDRVWKGSVSSKQVEVHHGTSPSSCGLRFEINERYLLAFETELADAAKVLQISLCSTERLSKPLEFEER